MKCYTLLPGFRAAAIHRILSGDRHQLCGTLNRLNSPWQADRLIHELSAGEADLLIADSRICSRTLLLESLKKIRLACRDLRILLLIPAGRNPDSFLLSLYALQIYDLLECQEAVTLSPEEEQQFSYLLYHPVDFSGAVRQMKPPEEASGIQVPGPQKTITVAALDRGVGCTSLSLQLASFLSRSHQVLLVEQNRLSPVLKDYYLEETYYDCESGLYRWDRAGTFCCIPLEKQKNWQIRSTRFSRIIRDMGVLSSPEDTAEFLHSDLGVLVSTGTPWHLKTVHAFDTGRIRPALWINFCPPAAFSDYARILSGGFCGIFGSHYTPDPLHPGREQCAQIRRLLEMDPVSF